MSTSTYQPVLMPENNEPAVVETPYGKLYRRRKHGNWYASFKTTSGRRLRRSTKKRNVHAAAEFIPIAIAHYSRQEKKQASPTQEAQPEMQQEEIEA